MRILVATGLYPPEIGGPATYAVLMEKHLPRIGIEVDVLPFRAVRHLPHVWRHIVYTFKLLKRARAADALFAQDTVSCGLPTLIAARLRRIRFVLRVPGDFAWEQGRARFGVRETLDEFRTKNYGWRVGVLRGVQKFVVKRADLVVVASRYFSDVVSEWGVEDSRIRVIPNGIQMPQASARPPVSAPYTALTIGRLVPTKGYAQLIDLIAHLPDWRLAIVGDGPLRPELERFAASLGASGRVSFTGPLAGEQLESTYSRAHAFVLNSESESFSFAVLEAMARGIPTIATRVGAIPEILEDGKEGVLVEPNDTDAIRKALGTVISNVPQWEKRTEVAIRKVRTTFDIGASVRQLADALKEQNV